MTPSADLQTWPRWWDEATFSADPATILKLIQRARERRSKMRRALSAVRAAKGRRAASRLGRRYMRSTSARIAVLATAMSRRKIKLDGTDPDALRALIALVPDVNPWNAGPARATAFPISKLDGSKRWVFAQTVLQKAISLLARDVAAALVELEPSQFITHGGPPKFEAWLQAELPHAKLVITTDIPACFDRALRRPAECGLPLPRRVRQEVLYRPKDRARFLDRGPRGLTPMSPGDVAKVSSPGRGYAQGTALASIASEVNLKSVLRGVLDVSPRVRAASIGDNLCILLRDPADEGSVQAALLHLAGQQFGEDSLGELTRRTRTTKATSWFSFCGRDYRLKGGKMVVRIDPHRAGKFGLKLQPDIEAAIRSHDPEPLERLTQRFVGYATQNADHPAAIAEALHGILHLARLLGSPEQKQHGDEHPIGVHVSPLVEPMD